MTTWCHLLRMAIPAERGIWEWITNPIYVVTLFFIWTSYHGYSWDVYGSGFPLPAAGLFTGSPLAFVPDMELTHKAVGVCGWPLSLLGSSALCNNYWVPQPSQQVNLLSCDR